MALRTARALAGALLIAAVPACDAGTADAPRTDPPRAEAPPPRSVRVKLGGVDFHLELAADPARRYRGLSRRPRIPADSGMLFAFPRPRRLSFVMRECLVPIDIAFLDASARVLAIHTMAVEPPRGPGETAFAYESRLPGYSSSGPAQFAVELAGGRLAQVGVRVGDRVAFDRAAVLRDTR